MSISPLIFPQLLLSILWLIGVLLDSYSTRFMTDKYGWAHEKNWLPRQVLQHPILELPFMVTYFLVGFLGIKLALAFNIFLAMGISIIPLLVGLSNLQYFYKYPRYHSVLGLNDVRG